MPSAAADWVATAVLTPAYLDSVGGLDRVRICPCQYGACFHCLHGNHDRCQHRRYEPIVLPAAYILARDGHVPHLQIAPKRWMDAVVLYSGRPCVWRCSCGCPPPVAGPEQLDLFAAAGAS